MIENSFIDLSATRFEFDDTSSVTIVLKRLAFDLQFLAKEVFEEDLLADGVDAGEVAAETATLFLGGVERHRLVDRPVAGTVDASTLVEDPPGRVCQQANIGN